MTCGNVPPPAGVGARSAGGRVQDNIHGTMPRKGLSLSKRMSTDGSRGIHLGQAAHPENHSRH